jgi:uncharacterized phage protein (predicted DNA packaging)
MIISLDEAKLFLRIDSNDDDDLINDLIAGAELYLTGATGKTFDDNILYDTNPLAKLYCKILVVDWYENRTLSQETRVSDKVRYTLQTIMMQLQYGV